MRSSEKETTARHARANGRSAGRGHANASLQELLRLSRSVPRKLQRNLHGHPETLLATVGLASFVAGMLLGSRLFRAILAAAVPAGVAKLIEAELGPMLWRYVQDALREDGEAHPAS